MITGEYPASWYAATRWNDAPRSAANGTIETDVCIIGGGYAGLHVARLLALRGLGVVVLERRRVGWGASGRNGGFVGAGFAQRSAAIIARVGEQRTRELIGLTRAAVKQVRAIAEGEDANLIMGSGKLSVYRTDQGRGFADRALALAAKLGTEIEPWSTDQIHAVVRSKSYFQGTYSAESFHVHPLNLALALARQIERAGGRIFEASEASRLTADGTGWKVGTSNGATIRARTVVLAGNADLGAVHGAVSRAVLPVATFVATTGKLGPGLREALKWNGGVSDTRRAGNYYRIVDGDRLLWGGRITTDTREPRSLRALMRRDILSVFPQLGDVSIEYAWPGIMGYAPHKMPQITKLSEGFWISSAFGGHGVAQTAAAAEIVAAGIAEADRRWQMFAPWGVNWAGGVVGRAATQGAYWWMQACDFVDERRQVR